MYQAGIKKEKLNSWKEFCNVAASINPWSQSLYFFVFVTPCII